jgi:putative SOS response-associated peptidase YedK
MCGRYGLGLSFSSLAALLQAKPLPHLEDLEWGPDYNLAPTDLAPVLLELNGKRRLGLFRWGLLPFWASDPRIAAKLINARSETVAEKPAFREAFATQRLLVPASGWYEWRHAEEPRKKKAEKPTPHWIHGANPDEMLMLAGLGSRWVDKASGLAHDTFTILTTDALGAASEVHDRMPLVLVEELQALWLSPSTPKSALIDVMQPYAGSLAHHEVSTEVNSVRSDGARLIEPVESRRDRQGKLLL